MKFALLVSLTLAAPASKLHKRFFRTGKFNPLDGTIEATTNEGTKVVLKHKKSNKKDRVSVKKLPNSLFF